MDLFNSRTDYFETLDRTLLEGTKKYYMLGIRFYTHRFRVSRR